VKSFAVSISDELTNVREVNLINFDPGPGPDQTRWIIVEPQTGRLTCELSIPSDARLLKILDELATDPPKPD
jgi:hypothetical protein